MKYLIILILLLISCIASNTTGSGQVSQLYYDGCQYITTELGGITHKGNCNNRVHD